MRHGEDTRLQQILEASLQVLAEKGMKGLTLRSVAKQAGVTEPALYRHVKSKTELVRALVERAEEDVRSSFDLLSKTPADRRDALRRFCVALYTRFRECPGYSSLLLTDELLPYAEGFAGQLSAVLERQIWRLSGYIEEGMKSGAFRSDIEPQAAAHMFLGAVRLEITRRHLEGGDWSPEEQGRQTAELCIRVLSSFPADDAKGEIF